MLQQTRVETVRPYYTRFMARFPTLAALAEAPLEDVLAAWSGLGYYRRARTLQAAARTIVAEHAGVFPRELESLLALPGIGPYTAGAVSSIAFEAREPLVDGNVARVFCRLFALAGEPTTLDAELWSRARALMPREGSCGDWNQALMELGALVCTPRDPRCGECPLRSGCRALSEGRVGELPWPKARPAMIAVELEVMVVVERGRWLLERRPSTGRMAGLWQLPTIEVAEVAGVAQVAEVARTGVHEGRIAPTRWPAGVGFRAAATLGAVRHTITHHKIRATVRTVDSQGFEIGSAPMAIEGWGSSAGFAWFERRDVDRLPLTGLARKVLRARFLAILAAPAETHPATSPRRTPSNPNPND